ncbi:nuclear transport factor 2 family protein [Agromyces sp. LHK192]|uniref:nuclear transport factor 2 family protein n=1 Tax=Agromyces sp. LHK192 TaxID=2498704 RepID=UPI000FDAB1AA|nr:nuclear transport factor 2 family protein [Agromyces sp. LHK192]
MTARVQQLIESMFAGVEARDLAAAAATMHEDVVFWDPHYPYPEMVGIVAVREGLEWGLSQMTSMRFDIERWFFTEDGLSAVVETSTHHVLKAGARRLDFPQVFVIDTDGEHITKLRAYEPYGPHGTTGFGLAIVHAVYRWTHRKPSAPSTVPVTAD